MEWEQQEEQEEEQQEEQEEEQQEEEEQEEEQQQEEEQEDDDDEDEDEEEDDDEDEEDDDEEDDEDEDEESEESEEDSEEEGDDEDDDEENKESYIMGIMSNCQSCLDPISGERLLVADLSYTIRLLSVEERFNLRNENELSDSVEDNALFERRSGTGLGVLQSLSGSSGGFERRGEDSDATIDGATVLLTRQDEFGHVVVLGAPASGKTTLLQKMRYWAAITAYQDEAAPVPVFVYLVGFAKFIMNGGACNILKYLEASSPAEQFSVIAKAHQDRTVLYLLDGLDECAQTKAQIQQYIASELADQVPRIVLSSRLAGFSDEHLAERYQFVQLELCNVDVQKMTAKRRLSAEEYSSFETMMSEHPMFALYATTPLALSLLIELFRHKRLASPIDARTGIPQPTESLLSRGVIF